MHNFLDVSWFMFPNLPRNLKHYKKKEKKEKKKETCVNKSQDIHAEILFFSFKIYASCLLVILCQQLSFLSVYRYFYFTCWSCVKCTNSCICIVQCHGGMGTTLLQIFEQNLKFFIFGKMLCFMCIQQKYVFL